MTDREKAQLIVDGATHGLVVLGRIRKQAEQTKGEQASEQHLFMASAGLEPMAPGPHFPHVYDGEQ